MQRQFCPNCGHHLGDSRGPLCQACFKASVGECQICRGKTVNGHPICAVCHKGEGFFGPRHQLAIVTIWRMQDLVENVPIATLVNQWDQAAENFPGDRVIATCLRELLRTEDPELKGALSEHLRDMNRAMCFSNKVTRDG